MGVHGSNRGVRRASYPSGPWIDEKGNPAKSPYDYRPGNVTPESKPKAEKLPNPDPNNYKILKAEEKNGFLILKVNYPDCTNFEGNKILVYEGVSLLDIVNQRFIDPHFFDKTKKVASPIARFVPTDQGWTWALKFTEIANEKEKTNASTVAEKKEKGKV